MPLRAATAVASPNIAFIKYWGNRDEELRLPENGSISMTLGMLETRTRVSFTPGMAADVVVLNAEPAEGAVRDRVSRHLDLIRQLAGVAYPAQVESTSNFPAGAGLASSAAAFAALTAAACAAAGLRLGTRDLSRIARRGSGSACRSIYGGFVEWLVGTTDEDSYAEPIAPPDHWALLDLITLVDLGHKTVGSTQGHRLASSSPLQAARISDAPRRLAACREAIRARDFASLAAIAETDSHWMHAVMLTSSPPLLYWAPATVSVMQAVLSLRSQGANVFHTIDAGPNVHCLCPADEADEIRRELGDLPSVIQILTCPVGGPAHLLGTAD
jgi:diphosphomevalonate decarboxylase